MTLIEKLGDKCTNTKCNRCPVWIFNHEGAGEGCHNNCVEAMRFPTVAAAVKLWINGKDFDKESLNRFGREDEDGKETYKH